MSDEIDIEYVCAKVLEHSAELARLKESIRERVQAAIKQENYNLAHQGEEPQWKIESEPYRWSNGRPSERLLPFLLRIGPFQNPPGSPGGLDTGDVSICNLCGRVSREGEEVHRDHCPGRWMPSTAHRYRDGKYIGSMRWPL